MKYIAEVLFLFYWLVTEVFIFQLSIGLDVICKTLSDYSNRKYFLVCIEILFFLVHCVVKNKFLFPCSLYISIYLLCRGAKWSYFKIKKFPPSACRSVCLVFPQNVAVSSRHIWHILYLYDRLMLICAFFINLIRGRETCLTTYSIVNMAISSLLHYFFISTCCGLLMCLYLFIFFIFNLKFKDCV